MHRRTALRILSSPPVAGLARAAGLAPLDSLFAQQNAPDVELALTAAPGETPLLPGTPTEMWRFTAQRVRGPVSTLQALEGSYLGPVIRLRRGQRFGYRQRKAPGDGHLVIVGGGTSHGVALSAPRAVRGATARLKLAGEGTLEAGGRALSPFHIGGKRRWFAEPPHMQLSMVWLPSGVTPPVVGAEVSVDVRMTTVTFDQVVLH